jgi:hypothetical protein
MLTLSSSKAEQEPRFETLSIEGRAVYFATPLSHQQKTTS